MAKIFTSMLFVMYIFMVSAQTIGIKTNALYWATTTPNVGFEISINKKFTTELMVGYNPWNFSEKKLRHRLYQAEVRYWTCEAFNGHFFGFHAHYSFYNVGGIKLPFGLAKSLEDNRYQGRLYGAGISYGYQWMLGKRWNLEANIGLGYSYLKYDKYACPKCGTWLGKENKHYFGPTKAAISLIYILK